MKELNYSANPPVELPTDAASEQARMITTRRNISRNALQPRANIGTTEIARNNLFSSSLRAQSRRAMQNAASTETLSSEFISHSKMLDCETERIGLHPETHGTLTSGHFQTRRMDCTLPAALRPGDNDPEE